MKLDGQMLMDIRQNCDKQMFTKVGGMLMDIKGMLMDVKAMFTDVKRNQMDEWN
jgi:hypothetical protein